MSSPMMSYVAMMFPTFLDGGRGSLVCFARLHCLAGWLSVYIRGVDHLSSFRVVHQTKTIYHLSYLSQWVSSTTTTKTPLTTAVPRAVLLALAALAVPVALTAAPEALAAPNTSAALKAVPTAVPAALVAPVALAALKAVLAVLAALTVVLTAALEVLVALVALTVALKAVLADAVRSHLPPATI
ncbi:hypothetical protein BO82DRAFT_391641, partial [Aspergillus uvarum CBS 121591]